MQNYPDTLAALGQELKSNNLQNDFQCLIVAVADLFSSAEMLSKYMKCIHSVDKGIWGVDSLSLISEHELLCKRNGILTKNNLSKLAGLSTPARASELIER